MSAKSRTHLLEAKNHAQRSQRLRNNADASGTGTHAQRNRINTKMTARMTKVISTPSDKQKNLTHLLEQSLGVETRRTTWGTLWMRRPHTQTCIAIQTVRYRLQKSQKKSAKRQRSQKCQTHLLAQRYGKEVRQRAWGTTRMGRLYARTCRASKWTREWLQNC